MYWACRSVGQRKGGSNLGLQSMGYNIHWYGSRGMLWESLVPTVEHYLLFNPRPQVLIIHLGSNDLGTMKGKELIENIKLDILRLRIFLPGVHLVWSEILPRRYWHFANNQANMEQTRKRVNVAVKSVFTTQIDNGFVIRHPNIRCQERNLYRYDGTHLSDVGKDIYLNNIQGALELFANSNSRVFPDTQ